MLGTTLITEPELVAEACGRSPASSRGIDARDGRWRIEGWRQGTEYGVLELVRDLEVLGVRRVAYTDIARDGMQTGVNYGAYRALARQVDIPVIASGGVATLDDIARPRGDRAPSSRASSSAARSTRTRSRSQEAIAAASGGG